MDKPRLSGAPGYSYELPGNSTGLSGPCFSMKIFDDITSCREAVRTHQRAGRTVGLVPTMGALHKGHRALIRASAARCDATVVTIFVNPTQFVPGEDFACYPRPIDADLTACRVEGVDIVFAPTVETMYAAGARTTVHVAGLTEGLCGPHRPGHFEGVATVVAKLFHIAPADCAFFGEKDYQQLAVIRTLVRDLNLPIEIVGCATVREPDGLAMSSRNAYLSVEQRAQSLSLNRALFEAAQRVRQGERRVVRLISSIEKHLRGAGPCDIDYVEIVDAESLEPIEIVDRPARICLAVRIGATRLIDNLGVDGVRQGG